MTSAPPFGREGDRPERVPVSGARHRTGGAHAVPAPDDLYHSDSYAETLLRSLMRAQLGVTLSILVPAAAVIAIYPLMAVLLPAVATASLGPVPLSAVILGVAIYPPLVLLAFLYVRRAKRMEQAFVDLLREQ